MITGFFGKNGDYYEKSPKGTLVSYFKEKRIS